MPRNEPYNADRKAEKRAAISYIIGEKTFYARKKSGLLMRELIEQIPLTPEGTEEQTYVVAGEERTRMVLSEEQQKEQSLDEIRLVYNQLATILRDPDASESDDDKEGEREELANFLEAELDFEDAKGILEQIMPDAPKA